MRNGRAPSSLLIAGLLGVVCPAQGADPLLACGAAHEQAQELRLKGRLLAATETLQTCKAQSCPLEIQNECRALETAIRRSMPSVVPTALAATGAELRGARVQIDAAEPGVPLEGKTFALDPGLHRFRFILADGRERVLTVELRAGDKTRPVTADFRNEANTGELASGAGGPNGEAGPPETDAGASVTPKLPYALGAVGVVAFGLFTYFALSGNAKLDRLEACKPNCTREGVDSMRQRYLLADISLGVSLASLGAATYMFLQPASSPAEGSARTTGLLLTFSGQY